jgi:hypothetical protein
MATPWSLLGLATALHFSDTPESRNCLVLGPVKKGPPASPDAPAFELKAGNFETKYPVHEDVLVFSAGGLSSANPILRRRAVAVGAPGCTLLGMARALLKTINTAAPRVTTGGPLTDFDLARGLLAYNQTFLGYTGPLPLPQIRWLPSWTAGTYLTLPLEFDTAAQAWITNFLSIRTWAGTLSNSDDWALGNDATALAMPDPVALSGEAAAVLAAHPDIAKLATTDDLPPGTWTAIRTQLLTNPFESMFRIVEMLRQLRAFGPASAPARRADVVKMIVALFETLTIQLLEPIAQSTAGNAVLRQFQTAIDDAQLVTLANPDPAELQRTRTKLAGALGLVADGTSWRPMRQWGPTVVPQELPLTAAQEVRTAGGNLYLQINTFGRALDISRADKPKKGMPSWDTLSLAGNISAVSWLAAHGADSDVDRAIGPVVAAAPHTAANPQFPPLVIERDQVRTRGQVAARIAGSEGGVDSCQAGDKGLVSYGFEQWAAHNEQELTVLFERYRAQAPDHYDLFFGMLGLATKRWVGNFAPVNNNNAVPDPALTDPQFADKVDDANPYGPDPSALGDPFNPADQPKIFDYFPFFVTFIRVAPGQQAEITPAGVFGSGLGHRYEFLMKDGRPRVWSARARMAALLSRAYPRVQLQQSAFRFTRIENEHGVGRFAPDPGAPFAVPSAEPTTLTAAITAATTTIKVAEGSVFPRSGQFVVICERELMLCTKRVTQTLTVQRGREGTTAAAHGSGAVVSRARGFAALSGGLNASDTAISVQPGGRYVPGSERVRLVCEQERMLCTARTAGTLTVQRGCEATTAAPHADGTNLYRIEGDTVLTGAIVATDTSVAVGDGSFVPAAGGVLLRCGSEVMRCTAAAGNTLTVVRGQEGTAQAPHPAGAPLYRVVGYAELFNSEFAAGALLDIHINAPGNAIPSVLSAIRRTPGNTHAVDATLDDRWLRRFGVNFLSARALNPDGSAWINARPRNNDMLLLHDKRPAAVGDQELGLSPDPGTFKSWKRSTP